MSSHIKPQELDSIVPNDKEIKLAQQSSRILSNVSLKKSRSIDIAFKDAEQYEQSITVPLTAFNLLVGILTRMAEGNAINVVSMKTELTTQEAADLLNVSRPYLIRLLEEKQIPFRKVGNRRKVLRQDILSYKAKIDEARRKVLEELVAEAQELDMGY